MLTAVLRNAGIDFRHDLGYIADGLIGIGDAHIARHGFADSHEWSSLGSLSATASVARCSTKQDIGRDGARDHRYGDAATDCKGGAGDLEIPSLRGKRLGGRDGDE